MSDAMREEIYMRVKIQGRSVRQVSAELAVSLERVAAVVRLKAVEKQWIDSVSGFNPSFFQLFPPSFRFHPPPAMRRKIKFS